MSGVSAAYIDRGLALSVPSVLSFSDNSVGIVSMCTSTAGCNKCARMAALADDGNASHDLHT